jgi:predicted CoA-binding protein
MSDMTDTRDARTILAGSRTVAVVGCSTSPMKVAHTIPAQLKQAGFRVIPVHPSAEEILGEPVVHDLRDVTEDVDLVVVFRPPAEAAGVARAAAEIGAGAVWLQQGIRSAEARQVAEDAGMGYVEDRCSGVDVMRWGIRAA